MEPNNAASVLINLECNICLELPKKAMESSYRHQIFCSTCCNPRQIKTCPICRKEKVTFINSHIVQRLIDNMLTKCIRCNADVPRGNLNDHANNCDPANCQYCNQQMLKEALKSHETICDSRHVKCSAPLGTLTTTAKEFVDHLVKAHKEELIDNAGIFFKTSQNVSKQYDRICARTNSDGHQARLGASGKYYCGAPMINCYCCSGYCGPSSGCNCASCMKLDVAARSLPAGYLVNCEGAIARKRVTRKFYCGRKNMAGLYGCVARKRVTGKFYCGRKNMTGVFGCDGYCGPTDGPNCRSCQILDLYCTRYVNLY